MNLCVGMCECIGSASVCVCESVGLCKDVCE